jgi:hypothetical protein
MTGDSRAAADAPMYQVRELTDGVQPVDLGLLHQCPDFLEAADFAFDYLESNDPLHEGSVSVIQIVRVTGSEREVVCSYRHTESAAAQRQDSVERWGFDVERWSPKLAGS